MSIIFDFAEINKNMKGDGWFKNAPSRPEHFDSESDAAMPCTKTAGPFSAVPPPVNTVPGQPMPADIGCDGLADAPPIPPGMGGLGKKAASKSKREQGYEIIAEIDLQIARERERLKGRIDRVKSCVLSEHIESAIREEEMNFLGRVEPLLKKKEYIVECICHVTSVEPLRILLPKEYNECPPVSET
jgi:hypothetical protein